MARTLSGFPSGNAPALPAVANGVPPLASTRSLFASSPSKMEERRIVSRKLLTPRHVSGNESPQERALVFYASKATLDTECRGIDFDVRIRALGTIMSMDFIAQRNMAVFIQIYEEQLEDPARFAIISFHDRRGA